MSPLGSVDPLPEGMPVVHLSDRDWELGKNYPTEWALRADVRETLSALLPRLRAQRSEAYEAAAAQRLAGLATRHWNATRASLRGQNLALADAQPIDARYLMMVTAETLPQDVVVVEEALTSTPALAAHLPMNDEKRFYGLSSGGLGFAMPGAVGIALGLAPRRVVAVVGDGSSLYSIQALWTAAHLRLPITYLIINNRGYRIIKERLLAMRGTDRFLGMDFTGPELDFVSIARGFGMDAVRITHGEDIAPALRAAVEGEGPRLVEVVVSNGFEGRTA
jgi:benzoylformate decarboxylase